MSFYFSYAQNPKKNTSYKFTYLYSEALKFKLHENYKEALNLFKQCLDLYPQSSSSFYELALINYELKDYEQAMLNIQKAINLQQDNKWYLLLKASIAGFLEDDVAYKSAYTALYKYYPDNPEYSYKLAVLFYKEAKYEESLKILNKIQEKQGVIENISFLKNNIFYQTKRYDLLLAELKKLVNVFPDSVKYIDMLGNYYSSMRQLNKALETYQNGLKLFPTSKRLNIHLAELYAEMKSFGEGVTFLLSGIGASTLDFESQKLIADKFIRRYGISKQDKIIIYQKLVLSFPDETVVQTEYIKFLLAEKELSFAEQEIKNIINRNPNNFELWVLLFNIYSSQDNYESLDLTVTKSKEYFPNQATVYFYGGYANFFLKRYLKAVDNLKTGLDFVLDNDEQVKQFYLYLGESYHALGESKKSDFYFEKYLLIDSTNPYLLNNYAYYLSQDKRNLSKALGLARKAIEIEPFNSSFLDTYAWIFYLMGSLEQAKFNIEKSYKYGGQNNPVICEHYAYILLKMNNKTEAVKLLQRSLKLNPNNTKLEKKLQTLKNQ